MEYKKYRDKLCKMVDEIFTKPDITVTELKNVNEALECMHKIDQLERGESMRDQYGSYGANSWVASGPYPDYDYGDSYGRRMRSSTTGRYMNNGQVPNGTYGHSIPDRMVANLEDMMDQAHNDYERQMIQKEIQNIRQNNMM